MCLSPSSLHESGAFRAKASLSSCLYHLRSVAQDLKPNRQSTNTELDWFSDETNKNSERRENVGRATCKQVCTMLERAAGKNGRAASEMNKGVVGSQSHGLAMKEA